MTHNETDTGCPDCDSPVVREGREAVCRRCGLVVDENPIDRRPQRRSYQDNAYDESERTGAPRTVARHDRGLSTTIGRPGERRTLPDEKARRVARLNRHHKRASIGSKRNRNEAYALGEIRRLADDVDLPTAVRDQACRVFQQAHDADLAHGRDLDALTAAAVYAASRRAELTRPIDEVADAARTDARSVKRTYLTLVQQLDLAIGPPEPREYLPRVASRVDADASAQRHARRLLAAVDDAAVTGRNPAGVAAAALYIANGDTITQATLASASNTTPETVRAARDQLAAAGLPDCLNSSSGRDRHLLHHVDRHLEDSPA